MCYSDEDSFGASSESVNAASITSKMQSTVPRLIRHLPLFVNVVNHFQSATSEDVTARNVMNYVIDTFYGESSVNHEVLEVLTTFMSLFSRNMNVTSLNREHFECEM